MFCSRWLISGACVPRGHVTGLLHYFLCCCVTLAFCFSNRVVSVEECGGHGVEGAVCHCGEARTVQPSVDEHSRHELCVCTDGLSYYSTAETSSDFSQTVFKYCTNFLNLLYNVFKVSPLPQCASPITFPCFQLC